MAELSPDGSAELRVLGLVDLHWSPRRPLELPDLSGIDLVLLGGDLTHFRGETEAREVIDRVRQQGPQVLAVCGNCDRPEVETTMQEMGVALDRRAEVVADVTFVGLSAGLPFGGCPYERTEEDYTLACEQAAKALHSLETAERPWVLVSHQPPYDTRCDLARGAHVGSRAIRCFIEKEQPDLVLCGHIHEAVGSDRIGRTQVINPGPWFAGHQLRFVVAGGAIEIE